MGLARRGTLNWEDGQKAAGTAATAAAGVPRRAGTLLRSMRLQLDQGRSPALRPQHLRWSDGRRFRASAAGRRRGYSSPGRPARTGGAAALGGALLGPGARAG